MQVTTINFLIATLCYADIFDYPLTADELRQWHIGSSSRMSTSLGRLVKNKYVGQVHPYYFLSRRSSIVSTRKKKNTWSQHKWVIARSVASALGHIPSVCLIGVSGGLALDNVDEYDDIDFFVITRNGTMWSTRLFIAVVLQCLGKRRVAGQTQVRDKICVNMIVTESALALLNGERDLFGAHEVLQMMPLVDRNHTHRKFLKANLWAKTFLPNAWREKMKNVQGTMYNEKQKIFFVFFIHFTLYIVHFLEPLARAIQLWYMQRHRTTEVISRSVLRFHPRDVRDFVKQELAKRLHRFNIPLDKIFYAR